MTVRNERIRAERAQWCVLNCITDGGRPLGTGLQEQVSNHLRCCGQKPWCEHGREKAWKEPRSVTGKKRTEGTTMHVSKLVTMSTAGSRYAGSAPGELVQTARHPELRWHGCWRR